MKRYIALAWSKKKSRQIAQEARYALTHQKEILNQLLQQARNTQFGRDHQVENLNGYESFREAIPIRDYESLRPYIDQAREGRKDILWKGKPLYWAKTSGTTSGAKYIPITKDSLPNHIHTARNMLFCYIAEKGNADILNGKMMFLSGSPALQRENSILTGRLSGIVQNHIPPYLRKHNLPTRKTNCIADWEEKLDAIVLETYKENMTLLSGIPPWVQMYFDFIAEKTGRSMKEVFPNFSLMVHGGTNIQPYQNQLRKRMGADVDWLETFPASEGFFAFQNSLEDNSLLLNTNSGIFYEFIPVDPQTKTNMRIPLSEVKVGVNYALLITSNAGLWAYDIGDVIRFTSIDPYKLVVKGRLKHCLSAFGEHVIAEEVESSMMNAAASCKVDVVDFTVAPYIDEKRSTLSCHEWLIEFDTPHQNLKSLAHELNKQLCEKNAYYDDLIKGGIISQPSLIAVPKGTFRAYMKSIGKLGEQNKVPHLQDNQNIVEAIKKQCRL